MLTPDYPIRTERLLLRPLDPAMDVDAVHAYQSRADICRYIPYDPRSRDEVAAWLVGRNRSTITAEGDVISLAVVLRASDELIGDVILRWISAEHRSGEIGYVLHPDHHGNGYASETCRALLAFAFDWMGLHRVIARIDARNESSAAVARRVGMRQEAVLVENEWFKGEWTTEIDFAILAAEWRARQPAPVPH